MNRSTDSFDDPVLLAKSNAKCAALMDIIGQYQSQLEIASSHLSILVQKQSKTDMKEFKSHQHLELSTSKIKSLKSQLKSQSHHLTKRNTEITDSLNLKIEECGSLTAQLTLFKDEVYSLKQEAKSREELMLDLSNENQKLRDLMDQYVIDKKDIECKHSTEKVEMCVKIRRLEDFIDELELEKKTENADQTKIQPEETIRAFFNSQIQPTVVHAKNRDIKYAVHETSQSHKKYPEKCYPGKYREQEQPYQIQNKDQEQLTFLIQEQAESQKVYDSLNNHIDDLESIFKQ